MIPDRHQRTPEFALDPIDLDVVATNEIHFEAVHGIRHVPEVIRQ